MMFTDESSCSLRADFFVSFNLYASDKIYCDAFVREKKNRRKMGTSEGLFYFSQLQLKHNLEKKSAIIVAKTIGNSLRACFNLIVFLLINRSKFFVDENCFKRFYRYFYMFPTF